MSIIVSYIYNKEAFVFSEGRLTTNTSIVQDDFDKTLLTCNDRLLCAFCGLLILNRESDETCTNVREIIEHTVKSKSEDTIPDIIDSILVNINEHFKITLPTNNCTIDIHFIYKVDNSDEYFNFRVHRLQRIEGEIEMKELENKTTANLFRVDGEDCARPIVHVEIEKRVPITNKVDTINKFEDAISIGILSSGRNQAGNATCGGRIFSKSIR